MDNNEKEGIAAILHLEALAGSQFDRSKAIRIWRSMTPEQKESALRAYAVVRNVQVVK